MDSEQRVTTFKLIGISNEAQVDAFLEKIRSFDPAVTVVSVAIEGDSWVVTVASTAGLGENTVSLLALLRPLW